MADESQPAVTPTANEEQGGKLTQPEIDRIVEERLARERKKYADYGDLKKAAEELAELKKSQLSELDKLRADLAERDKLLQAATGELNDIKLQQMKASKLTEAGISADWIDSVSGTTEEEIAASVSKIAARLSTTQPKAAQGAGNPGIPGQKQSEIATMSRSELVEKSKNRDWYEANRDAILERLQKI